jgi:hypothetical protein
MMILNIIATNKWERPIYFTSPFGELGFGQYLRKDGLAYRLVPFIVNAPQQNWTLEQVLNESGLRGSYMRDNNLTAIYDNLIKKYQFGGANKSGVYFDEENRRHLLSIRAIFAEAAGNLADAGKTKEAEAILEKVEKGILPENLPYGMTSRYNQHNQTGLMMAEAYYKAGKLDQARKVINAVKKDLDDQAHYYNYMRTEKPDFAGEFTGTEEPINSIMKQAAEIIEQRYDPLKKIEQNPEKEIIPNGSNAAADTAKKAQ